MRIRDYSGGHAYAITLGVPLTDADGYAFCGPDVHTRADIDTYAHAHADSRTCDTHDHTVAHADGQLAPRLPTSDARTHRLAPANADADGCAHRLACSNADDDRYAHRPARLHRRYPPPHRHRPQARRRRPPRRSRRRQIPSQTPTASPTPSATPTPTPIPTSPPTPTTPPSPVCQPFSGGKTIGYWKNHTGLDSPPRDSTYDELPSFLGIPISNGLPEMPIDSEDEARDVFQHAKSKEDGVAMLQAQLLASKLNALKYNGYADAYLPGGQKMGDVVSYADEILDDLAHGINYNKDTIVHVKSLLDLANNNGEGSQVLETCTYPPAPPTASPAPSATAIATPTRCRRRDRPPVPTPTGGPGNCGANTRR